MEGQLTHCFFSPIQFPDVRGWVRESKEWWGGPPTPSTLHPTPPTPRTRRGGALGGTPEPNPKNPKQAKNSSFRVMPSIRDQYWFRGELLPGEARDLLLPPRETAGVSGAASLSHSALAPCWTAALCTLLLSVCEVNVLFDKYLPGM